MMVSYHKLLIIVQFDCFVHAAGEEVVSVRDTDDWADCSWMVAKFRPHSPVARIPNIDTGAANIAPREK